MIASIIPKLLSTYFIGRLGFLLLENGIVGISIIVICFDFQMARIAPIIPAVLLIVVNNRCVLKKLRIIFF